MRANSLCLIIGALSATCATIAQGQHADADPHRLTFGMDSLDIFVLSGGVERRVGRLWDEVHRVEIAGASFVRRVYRTENSLFGPTLDSTYFTWPGLRPHAHTSKGTTSAVTVEYRGDSVVGHRSEAPGARLPIARRLQPTVVDAASVELRLRSSSLSIGVRLSEAVYLAAQDSVATVVATVTGQERWRSSLTGQVVDLWVIQMDFAGLSSTLWIDTTSHALVREAVRLTPDVTMMWSRPQLARVGG